MFSRRSNVISPIMPSVVLRRHDVIAARLAKCVNTNLDPSIKVLCIQPLPIVKKVEHYSGHFGIAVSDGFADDARNIMFTHRNFFIIEEKTRRIDQSMTLSD